jgi:uncharacterized membrane protein YfcA
MRRIREIGSMLGAAAAAQAGWELEVSAAVLGSRKRLIGLLLLAFPVFLLAPSQAAQILPEQIPILGGSRAFMPSYVTETMFFGSILVGLIAGLITGVIGAGGGYILTPALMSFGVRGIMAVGTDQFHLFAKAIVGTAIHRKLGNVHLGLAAWFVVGSLAGVTAGGTINRAIFQYSPALSDALISSVYVLVLGILGVYAIVDWLRSHSGASRATATEATTKFAKAMQRIPVPPHVSFDANVVARGRRLSVYPIIACGLVVGFVASIMGVGGGFLTFPMYVYGLGVSTFTTVGTDILQIIFTTCYSSIFQYAVYGFVFYTVAIGMLLGSLVGVQIGALVTQMMTGTQIRALYALTILAGFANRVCALPRKLADLGYLAISRESSVRIETVGTVLFFGFVGLFALWTLEVFVRNVIRQRRSAGETRIIRDRRKFGMGVAGLATFFVLLVAMLLPVVTGRSALVWADTFFNQLAKHSAYAIPEGRAQAREFAGSPVDLGIRPRDFADAGRLALLVRSAGIEAKALPDGRVRVTGDLGKLSDTALADAEAVFGNETEALAARYRMRPEEVIYGWWVIFDGLTRRYVQEARGAEAEFTRFVSSRVLEPAYNFRGIEAKAIQGNAMSLAGLLAFYVLYTLWYGFSIMMLFEGLGIGVDEKAEKREI